jgi:plasmid stabilization system protein ParE
MVIWTDNAISHITEFIDNAKIDTEETAKSYMRKLVDYTDILETMPEIGKNMEYIIFNYEIRQMIYKKHRIIYHINGNDVVILAVLHTKLDINKALKKLKRDIE